MPNLIGEAKCGDGPVNTFFYILVYKTTLPQSLQVPFEASFEKYSDKLSLRKKCPYSELFWSAFSRIRTEYEWYRVSLCIQSECGKMRTRITPNTDTFHEVYWKTSLRNVFPSTFLAFSDSTFIKNWKVLTLLRGSWWPLWISDSQPVLTICFLEKLI